MKKLLFPLLAGIVLVSCSQQQPEATEEKIELGESYGPAKVDVEKAITVQEFFTDFEKKDGPEEYTIEGKIVEVCQKAGCWVGIDDGKNDYFMVRFKDHFTIPLDTKMDTHAYMHGVATWDSIPVAQLKEDAVAEGKSKEEIEQITQPQYIFAYVADGIVMKK